MKKTALYLTVQLFVFTAFSQFKQTEELVIHSKIFNGDRKLKICLPAEYDTYPQRNYNVVYLFDAQSDGMFDYAKATISYLMSDANIFVSPVILVGIETQNRYFEFLPKNRGEQPLKDYGQQVKLGGADTLSLHLRDEVIPFIQNKYRCNSFTIGIGHSLGATFLTYNLLNYPSIFNAVIAVSPNYYYDDEQILPRFDSMATEKRLDKKFLYIAYGKGDKLETRFRPATMKMQQLLHKKNIRGFTWQVDSLNNDSHATTPMEGNFKGLVALNKLFIATDEQIDSLSNDKKTSITTCLKNYYGSNAKKYNVAIPTVQDINHLAYNFFGNKQETDAIEILTWAISLYPRDTNLYDSMGELLQLSGNKGAALDAYRKGLDLVEQFKADYSPETFEGLKKGFEERIKSVTQR